MKASVVPSHHAAATNYYPWFDWLRIILALVVMLYHDGIIHRWPHSGNFAVQIFFALSGWLIGGMLLRLSTKDLPRFYFNRAIRIWIPYYIAFSLLLMAALIHDVRTAKWWEFIGYQFSFVYNLFGTTQLATFQTKMPLLGTGNHLWSVNAEEQFYLLSPLLLVCASTRYGRSVTLWLLLALVAWLTKIYASIILGVLAAVLAQTYGHFYLTRRVRGLLLTIVALSSLGFIQAVDYELLAPLCSIAIVLLLAVTGKQHRFGAFAGGISYPLYLNHWIGVFVAHAVLNSVIL
jgi:peptidoglycan/LPS O-acetylase OafA/YrhL